MMAEKISPEEKLFKIIQQEKTVPPAQHRLTDKKGTDNWLNSAREAAVLWKDSSISIIKNFIGKFRLIFPAKPFDLQLKTINVVLALLLLVIISFVIYYAVTKYPSVAKIAVGAATAQSSLKSAHKDAEEFHAASYYIDDARQRNIFTAVPRPVSMSPETPAQGSEKSLSGDLKVQGISWSDVPKVMIQSEKDNKLYILKQGQPVGSTGIKVKTIFKNKAILTYGDKDFEL